MIDLKELEVDDVIAYTQFFKVSEVSSGEYGEYITAEDINGEMIDIGYPIVKRDCLSADQFTETKKITNSEMIEIYKENRNTPMTVTFRKKIKEKDTAAKIVGLDYNRRKGETKVDHEKIVEKVLKEALKGKKRIMRGYHTGTWTAQGRSVFIDMDVPDKQPRQVTTSTMEELVVGNTKYVKK